jgi:hypothetical protein
MNVKIIKLKWISAKILCLIGTFFWIIETIYFLIIYGWHWTPINKSEIVCDNIALLFWSTGIVVFGIVFMDIVEYLLSTNKKY